MTDRPELPDDIPDPPLHYDRQGQAISLRRWVELWYDDEPYSQIALTWVGRWAISTVWIGINANPIGPPLIFETMVFDRNAGSFDDWEMRRYSTEEQARTGHEDMVTLVAALDGAGREAET